MNIFKSFDIGEPARQPSGLIADPDLARTIFIHGLQAVEPKAQRVMGIIEKLLKCVSVITIQSVFGGDPEITTAVLQKRGHHVAGEAVFGRQF